jgi:transposase
VLGVGLSEGQAGDAPAAEPLLAYVLADERIAALAADRAYDSDAIRGALALAGKEAVIPPKANRLVALGYDKAKYRGRNRIERLVGRAKQFRGVATRYDKLDVMFLGTVLAALIVVQFKEQL